MSADLFVVDASAVVATLTGTKGSAVVGQLFADEEVLTAPAHLDVEVLSALAQLFRAGLLSAHDVEDLLDELADAKIDRLPLDHLTREAFDLRDNVAMADGVYVALSRFLGATLVTADRRLGRACVDHRLCSVLLAIEERDE